MNAFLVAGCTSDAGKSVVVAGLCRAFARRGVKVAPFKAQNMSNNSAVTPDGGEIGRAQALQALACGLEPSTRFNPILLKPGSDRTSQLVVHGKATGNVSARNYIEHRAHLREVAAEALAGLRREFDLVICEGAGSPAEINLRETDVANFGLAQAADLPVYLVGDIDRGGVLAHFYGTHQIVRAEDRARIKGFVVNKFRGDASILQPGLEDLARRTGVETLAVLPFIEGLWVDAEDSLQSSVGATVGPSGPGMAPVARRGLSVAAVRLPRVSNATDVEALACEPGVHVRWTDNPNDLMNADLVVLPGSKATVSDLAWLRSRGLDQVIVSRTLPTLGICGGYQMMCREIVDPQGVEAPSSEPVLGLGIFDARIVFQEEKTLIRHSNGAYEVHHGQVVDHREQTWIGDEGSQRGVFFGTHRHGQLEHDAFRKQWLRQIAPDGFEPSSSPNASFHGERLRQLDLIADTIEQHWDLDALLASLA
ncbi:cobyric acid synthase [Corynebacterium sp. 153RC1]|uniref:cobyric acid synthase n=1 Tax=unclassified Corynebacterium TaxID=2624378 RepID=UPI00211B755E|nr:MULTISPECIES: cobyric acid synthase [unclassified Corynebacterium]MCQ9371684.1 cobyric acid synthase [Corynebacterium sp. 35RC1]MCQ9351619.1 cobyric acid synthase [Corynebacterium sp. 209RC1]MCQ9353988.1 cobyric acid synthase [Corynebacterium sp. 1222RC1]MCQ9355902.1 cobyric acid synthase [Corynebacterium sp. 122RC1]MCQ9358146.1 cobyric acid synthase [Corynebacterium sp. 142RC1]